MFKDKRPVYVHVGKLSMGDLHLVKMCQMWKTP